MKNILVVSEKPSVIRRIAPHVEQAWPGAKITFCSILSIVNPRMRYPRGLSWADYPYIGTPQYTISPIYECDPHKNPTGNVEMTELSQHNLKKGFDQIVYACDPDHSGAVSFAIIFEGLLGEQVWTEYEFQSVVLSALDHQSIANAFRNLQPFPIHFENELAYGYAKRYLEWNWNTNSLAILGEVLRRAGAKPYGGNNPFISKYGLQALYFIERNPGHSIGGYFAAFDNWKGSGKYSVTRNFGSCVSRTAFFDQLIGMSLVERISDSQYTVSATGVRFLEMLHKDCHDPDLPSRINAWGKEGLEKSKASMDRYIRTFFGKQKNAMSTP